MAVRRPRINVKPNVQATRPVSSIVRPPEASSASQEDTTAEQIEVVVPPPIATAEVETEAEKTVDAAPLLPPPPPPLFPSEPLPSQPSTAPDSAVAAPSSPPPAPSPVSTPVPATKTIFRRRIPPNIAAKSVIHHRRPSASCSGTESESESSRQKHTTASSITFTRLIPPATKTIAENEPQPESTPETPTNGDTSHSAKAEAMATDAPEIPPVSTDHSHSQSPMAPTRMNTRISREYLTQHINYRAQRQAAKVEPEMTIRKRRAATLEKLDETGANKGVPVDTSKLKIADFVHYNPVDNPMEVKAKSAPVDTSNDPVRKHSMSSSDVPSTSFAPQLKIDANGALVVDEESLYIRNMDDTPRNTVIVEGQFNDDNLTHQSYRKIGRRKRWSNRDTLRFYQALRMCGTDFTLIARVFPNRDRDDIKRKFKTEDKANRTLIDSALSQRVPFDVTCFYSPSEDSTDEDEGNELDNGQPRKARKRRLVKRKAKQTSSSDPLEINRRRERRLQRRKNDSRVKKSAEFIDEDDDEDNEDNSMDVADTVEVTTTQAESKSEQMIPSAHADDQGTENSLSNVAELETLLGRIDGGHLLFVHNTDEATGLDRIDVHVVMHDAEKTNVTEQSL